MNRLRLALPKGRWYQSTCMLPIGIPFNPKAPEEPRTGASARSAQPSPEVPEHSPTPPSMVLNYDYTGPATSTVGSFQIGGAVNPQWQPALRLQTHRRGKSRMRSR
jgi:hypothetical protein